MKEEAVAREGTEMGGHGSVARVTQPPEAKAPPALFGFRQLGRIRWVRGVAD